MLLTIDVGNTNVVIISYVFGVKKDSLRFETIKENAYEAYREYFSKLGFSGVENVVVSSVVPRIREDLERALQEVYGVAPFFIHSQNVKDFKSELRNASEIGADFIATSVGAHYKYPGPLIVADLGSASKLSLTSADGVYKGGIIMPGIQTSLQAFLDYIPHLPAVSLNLPKHVLGQDTVSAIQSGLLYGLIAQIEGLALKIEEEYGQTCIWILTGGYANLIKEGTDKFIFDSDLLHDGLFALVTDHRLL